MADDENTPLCLLTEAVEWSATRAAAYFLAWLLGINLPRFGERLFLGDITGRPATFGAELPAGVVAASHLAHPLGFLILLSHIVLFAVFVRFGLRFRWILWPLASGLFWRIFIERL